MLEEQSNNIVGGDEQTANGHMRFGGYINCNSWLFEKREKPYSPPEDFFEIAVPKQFSFVNDKTRTREERLLQQLISKRKD